MAVTVLSGTSGALYYKPAGTSVELAASAFPASAGNITVGAYLGFRVNDPVTLTYPAGATTTNAITAGAAFVKTYSATTGIMTISATAGGSALTATALPSGFGALFATIAYTDFAAVASVQNWSFNITRAEIDTTTIGQALGQYAPFRTYIPGFAEGDGSATVFVTSDDTALANRMVEDVLQRQQVGAAFKLYMDKQSTEVLSRSIAVEATLLSASRSINPDDAQIVEITFRPNGVPTFDFSTTA
jgi:hypothetical protein